MAGAGVPVPMDDGLAMRGCGRLGTPHRKALSDRAAVYYNSRVRSWGLGRLEEMLRSSNWPITNVRVQIDKTRKHYRCESSDLHKRVQTFIRIGGA